jgi:lipid-binding SYLF domain-containing protein
MIKLLALTSCVLPLAGCLSPSGDSRAEKVASALEMRDHALAALYAENPDLKEEVEKSVGYVVFSNFSVHPGLFSFAKGYGVLTNKKAGRDSHMKWFRLTIGPGIAVKGLYALAVFHDQEVMERFEAGCWTGGGQAEAGFVFGDFGGALEAAWLFNRKVDGYYITHTGVALELELIGIGKVSNNSKLNRPASPGAAP